MDTLTPEQRSALMSRIRSKDTVPEKAVRSLVHAMGYRFRLHRRDLPGTPDMAFIGMKKVIFVHGCFWHRHSCTKGRHQPSSNTAYWQSKFERNRLRDLKNNQALRRLGWRVLTIWECQLKDLLKVERRIRHFLTPIAPKRK